MPKGTPYIQPSQRQDWETPRELFDALWDAVDGFNLDPCCQFGQYTGERIILHGGTRYFPPGSDAPDHLIDGLAQPWFGKVYMNPPYGLVLRQWVPKAVSEVESGNAELVVALLPAKTDTKWWQEYVLRRCRWYPYMEPGDMTCDEVRFIEGRLRFGGADSHAGFASAIVVWRREG